MTPVSLGGMRFPRDTRDAVELVRRGIDAGMRYIDTSRGYGECEWILNRALRDGYREKVILSAKWSPWIAKIREDDVPTAACVRRRIEESMMRLGVDYLDFYQIWNIDSREHYDQAMAPSGMLEGILKARDDGLIGHTGFTAHDSVENLLQYLDKADWCETLLVSFNFLEQTYAPVLRKASSLGIGTLVMNPVGGGRFGEASSVFEEILSSVGADSVSDLAVRFVASHPHVHSMLNGIETPEDVEHTIASAAKPRFTSEQMETIDTFAKSLFRESVGYCTACLYCMPCPEGINIARTMTANYEYRFLGLHDAARRTYNALRPKPSACTRCGACLEKCTQKLPIPDEMAWAAKTFESKE